MQLKPITAIAVLLLVVVLVSISGCTSSNNNNQSATSASSSLTTTTANTKTATTKSIVGASPSPSATPSLTPSSTPSITPSPSQTPTVTPTPSGQQIVVAQGQQFPIALHGNPTTGYEWQPTFDAGAIVLKNQTSISDFPNDMMTHVGAGGTQVFTFQALKAGTTSITFSYERPWEGVAIQSASYTVIVR